MLTSIGLLSFDGDLFVILSPACKAAEVLPLLLISLRGYCFCSGLLEVVWDLSRFLEIML